MPTYMIIKKYYDDFWSAYNDAEPGDIIYQIPEDEGIKVVDPPESVKLVGKKEDFISRPFRHTMTAEMMEDSKCIDELATEKPQD
jgi:hypothetical protein